MAAVGWLAGLLINILADQLPTRTRLHWPQCTSCKSDRPALAISAIIALFTGQVRCQACGEPYERRWRSIIVEAATPLLFIALAVWLGPSVKLIIVATYSAILLLITVTDLEHRLIFNVVILPSILLALAFAFVNEDLTWRAAIVGGAAGFLLSYIAALLARGGLGAGDVTLSALLGVMLGFPHILLSLLLGVLLGGVVVSLLLVTRQVNMKTFVPYGPFLTVTGWSMLLWGETLWIYFFR